MKKLLIIPHQQSTGVYVLHRDDPDNPIRWLIPESVSGAWGFELVKGWYCVPGARRESHADGCIHSPPCLGTLPPGGTLEAKGNAWIVRGGIRELAARAVRP